MGNLKSRHRGKNLFLIILFALTLKAFGQEVSQITVGEYIEFDSLNPPDAIEATQLSQWMKKFVQIENRKLSQRYSESIIPEAVIALGTASAMARDIYANRTNYAQFFNELLNLSNQTPVESLNDSSSFARFSFKSWLAQRFEGSPFSQSIETSISRSHPSAYVDNFIREMVVELPSLNQDWPEFARRHSTSPINYIDYEIRYSRAATVTRESPSIRPAVVKLIRKIDPMLNFLTEYVAQVEKMEGIAQLYQTYGDKLKVHTDYTGGEIIDFDPRVIEKFYGNLNSLTEFFNIPKLELMTNVQHFRVGNDDIRILEPEIYKRLHDLSSSSIDDFSVSYKILKEFLEYTKKSSDLLVKSKANLFKMISYRLPTDFSHLDETTMINSLNIIKTYFTNYIFNGSKMGFLDTTTREGYLIWNTLLDKLTTGKIRYQAYFHQMKDSFSQFIETFKGFSKIELKRRIQFTTKNNVDRFIGNYKNFVELTKSIDKNKVGLQALGVGILIFCGYEIVDTMKQGAAQDGLGMNFHLQVNDGEKTFSMQLELPHFENIESLTPYVADLAMNDYSSFQFYYNFFKSLEEIEKLNK